MTRIFYDCEFLEDGRTIDLISIGMAAEDGREFYAVAQEIEDDPLYTRICHHKFLMSDVVPHLPVRHVKQPEAQHPGVFRLDDTSNVVMPRRMIRNSVRDFISGTPDVELWAWYGAYDHVAYAQLFGRMVDLPPGFPMHTNDLKQEVDRRGNPQLPKPESGLHHAIADARWNRDVHAWLVSQ